MVTFTPPGQASSWTSRLHEQRRPHEQKLGDAAQTYAFNYDLSSNLRSVRSPGPVAGERGYVIDGMNRRIEKAIDGFGRDVNEGLLYDEQGRVVAELDGSNNVLSTFVYGLKPNVPDYMVRAGWSTASSATGVGTCGSCSTRRRRARRRWSSRSTTTSGGTS
jgi:hypothetical protein